MQYPRMGNSRPYRISIPQLNGGVNVSVPPHLIQDNQLSDVKNMWYKNGRLQTRPAFKSVDSMNCTEQTFIKTLKARDKVCVISSAVGTDGNGYYIFNFWNAQSGKFTESNRQIRLDTQTEAPKTVLAIENSASVTGTDGVEYKNAEVIFYVASVDDNDNPVCKAYGVGSDLDPVELEPYIPTVTVEGKPTETTENTGEGTLFEPYNLLTNRYKCQYTTDGVGMYFKLPVDGYTLSSITITYNGIDSPITQFDGPVWYSDEINSARDRWAVYPDTGIFFYQTYEEYDDGTVGGKFVPVALSLADFGNNVSVTVCQKRETGIGVIEKMTVSSWFGGGASGLSGGTRLFVAGNSAEPNVMRWSSLSNPLYFPENNYTYVGDNAQAITAFGKQSDMLVIFKEKELYFSYYVQGRSVSAEAVENQEIIDIEAARAVFPVYQLHPHIGCDLPNTICLCNNRLVWFNSDKKAYALFTAGLYSERNVRRLSDVIDDKLQEISDEDIQTAFGYELDDHYLIHVGTEVFVMDYSSNGFSYYSSYSSDEKAQKAIQWYCWELFEGEDGAPRFVSAVTYNGQTVMLAETSDTVYATWLPDRDGKQDIGLNGNAVGIRSMFATKLFDFGYPERYKRINPFYLQVNGADGETLKLTYLNENGGHTDACSPTLDGEVLEKTDPRRISPNAVRVREFGIKVECDGYMEVGSLVLNYAMMGTVR